MQRLQIIFVALLSSVLGQQHCDDKTKEHLQDLQDSQVAAFQACAPGKKIWDILLDLKAPNFKTCVCDDTIRSNLTLIRQDLADCDPQNRHDLAQTDALLEQWKISCHPSAPTTSQNDKSGGEKTIMAQGIFCIVVAMTAVAFAL